MSIPLQFFTYWGSGQALPYVRYLTLATLRYHHPESEIFLYESFFNPFEKFGFKLQEFQLKLNIHDYRQQAIDRLGVKPKKYEPKNEAVLNFPPTSVSDVFSAEVLFREGGWYLDLDQMVVKSFENLSQNYDFLGFGGLHPYIGIFGSAPGSWVMKEFYEAMVAGWDPTSYNSTGIYALSKACIENESWMVRFRDRSNGMNHIAPMEWFYPITVYEAEKFWGENWEFSRGQTYCIHFYGASVGTQAMVKKMSPEYVLDKSHNDTLSRYIREITADGKQNKNWFCFE